MLSLSVLQDVKKWHDPGDGKQLFEMIQWCTNGALKLYLHRQQPVKSNFISNKSVPDSLT